MNKLDEIKVIEKFDQGRMRDILQKFPQQIKQAYELGAGFSLPRDFARFKNIMFCGMGGSAIGAEIISYYLRNEITTAINVNRDYSLPAFVGSEHLVILSSYSGNTEETISAYNQAKKRQTKILVLSSGGKLIDLAKRDGCPYLIIPSGLIPRAALAFLSFPVLALFVQMRLIANKDNEVKEVSLLLERLGRESLGINVKGKANPAKKLAKCLFDNFCVIYGSSEHLAGVVTRWRGQLAENSKMLASSHVFPEMNHNEIVGWRHPQKLLKKFIVVILRDKADHPQVQKRIEISKELWQQAGVRVKEVYSRGSSLLARTFSLIYIGDFVSFYLALLNAEDPTPVKRIDYLKKRLKEL